MDQSGVHIEDCGDPHSRFCFDGSHNFTRDKSGSVDTEKGILLRSTVRAVGRKLAFRVEKDRVCKTAGAAVQLTLKELRLQSVTLSTRRTDARTIAHGDGLPSKANHLRPVKIVGQVELGLNVAPLASAARDCVAQISLVRPNGTSCNNQLASSMLTVLTKNV